MDGGRESLTYENYTLSELLAAARSSPLRFLERLRELYEPKRQFPDFGNFRLGPNTFEHIPLDWCLLVDSNNGRLLGHAVATRIPANGTDTALPQGWQATVRDVYENFIGPGVQCDTGVGLFVYVERAHRRLGCSRMLVVAMVECARRNGLKQLVIPLRLPTVYEEKNATKSFRSVALCKDAAGKYRDPWLRLHVQLGAEICGLSERSHQHALSLEDYQRLLRSASGDVKTGYEAFELNGEHYRAYVDARRGVAVINEGCVWVRHPVRAGVSDDAKGRSA